MFEPFLGILTRNGDTDESSCHRFQFARMAFTPSSHHSFKHVVVNCNAAPRVTGRRMLTSSQVVEAVVDHMKWPEIMNQRFRSIAGPPCGARLEKWDVDTALAWMDDDLGDMEQTRAAANYMIQVVRIYADASCVPAASGGVAPAPVVASENDGVSSSGDDALDYKIKIRDAVLELASVGTFVTHGKLDPSFDPELSIAGVGRLTHPLSPQLVADVIARMEQAPFGLGSATVVDLSVRTCWQLDASQVTTGSRWATECLPHIVAKACEALHVDAQQHGVEAHLYKLLCYQTAGHFKKHRDTEKEPGMFATLIVQLRSAHQGGDLLVEHKGQAQRFSFAAESETDLHFVAFFADCEHCLEPVVAGTRFVLAYNLVRTKSAFPLPTAEQSVGVRTALIGAVNAWKRDEAGPDKFAFVLDHEYTRTNLSFAGLKGDDKCKLDMLRSVRDASGSAIFEVCLCLVEKVESGVPSVCYGTDDSDDGDPDTHSMRSGFETTTRIDTWVGPKGPISLPRFDYGEVLSFNDDIDPVFGAEAEPSYKLYEKYMGNYGPSLEYFYGKALIVIWPKSISIQRLCQLSAFSAAVAMVENEAETLQPQVTQSVLHLIQHAESNPHVLSDDAALSKFVLLCLDTSGDSAHNYHLLALLSILRQVGVPGPQSSKSLAKVIIRHGDDPSVLAAIEALVCVAFADFAAAFIFLLANLKVAPSIIERFSCSFAKDIDAASVDKVSAVMLPILKFLCSFVAFEDVLARVVERCSYQLPLKTYSEISRWFVRIMFPPGLLSSQGHVLKLLAQVTCNCEFQSIDSGLHLEPRSPLLANVLSIFCDFLFYHNPSLLEDLVGTRGCRGLMGLSEMRLKIVSQCILANDSVKIAVAACHPVCYALCSALVAQLSAAKPPEFTWCMPLSSLAQFESPSVPIAELLAFLQSPEVGPFVVRGFKDIRDACDWTRNHVYWRRDFYSICGEASGSGHESIVTVTKTKELHDIAVRAYEREKADLKALLLLQDQAKLRFMSSIVRFSCHHQTRSVSPPSSLSHVLLLYPAPRRKHGLPLLSRAQLLQLLCLCSHVRHMQAVLLRSKLQTRMLKPRSVIATRICSEAVVRRLLRQGGGGGRGGVEEEEQEQEQEEEGQEQDQCGEFIRGWDGQGPV